MSATTIMRRTCGRARFFARKSKDPREGLRTRSAHGGNTMSPEQSSRSHGSGATSRADAAARQVIRSLRTASRTRRTRARSPAPASARDAGTWMVSSTESVCTSPVYRAGPAEATLRILARFWVQAPDEEEAGHHVQFSRDRVLLQDTAVNGASEETSTPETLTTACHAAS